MEETRVKKEIVVKRLSAFKFAVEVNTQQNERKSVIHRAPPASPPSRSMLPIRHAIQERIVELLLWKLLGEQRLRAYCGYPNAPACSLLQRVLRLSITENSKVPRTASLLHENTVECNGTETCFKKQVAKFLKICAPDEEVWGRFGWKGLSEEAILRKIYEEELSPNLRPSEIEQDLHIMAKCADIHMLLQWERQGVSTVPLQNPQPLPSASHTLKIFPRRSLTSTSAVRGRSKMFVKWGAQPKSPQWTSQPRPTSPPRLHDRVTMQLSHEAIHRLYRRPIDMNKN